MPGRNDFTGGRSTRIIVSGDIHLGITSEDTVRDLVRRMANRKPDVFIVAGDIAETGGLEHGLAILEEVPQKMARAVLLGNHDLWSKDGASSAAMHSSREIWECVAPQLCVNRGWIWLEDDMVTLGSTAIVGTIAWYDYSGHPTRSVSNTIIRARKSEFNNDGNYMDWDWDDVSFATQCRNNLFDRLDRIHQDAEIDNVILVTHVPVLHCQQVKLPSDVRFADSYFYHFSLGDEVLKRYPKITTVVSAHTHRHVDTMVTREDGPPVRAKVVPSDYGKPGFLELCCG